MKLFLIAFAIFGLAISAKSANSNPPYKPGDTLKMYKRDGSAPVEPGTAQLICDGENLIITADFTDSDIGNSAVKNNEKTWTTGDVCEFFFQPVGREDYYEFHVTPNGITLQLHIPKLELLRVLPFEEKLFESGFKSEAKVEKGHWTAKMIIPLSSLGKNVKFEGSLFAVCRYNYNKNWDGPEQTSSTPLPTSFHSPSEWHKISD
ncbi:MAG: hypothetical protein Q4G69_14955 [Planctomycetia bacterium]|nr:hypothetical protein [Planctomycetia bacterium]